MPGKIYSNDILKQAQDVATAWNQINNTLVFGALNPAALTADITSFNTVQAQISNLELQLTDLRNRRDALGTGLWDKIKRVRAGIKANYGDDSSQFEMVGGTRLSDRKSPTRKAVSA